MDALLPELRGKDGGGGMTKVYEELCVGCACHWPWRAKAASLRRT